jgi:hypothetical protein
VHGVPSFRSFKMLDLAVHMPAGVNGVSQNSLQTDVILRLDSSSIRFAFKVPLAHHDIKPRVPGAVGRQLSRVGGEPGQIPYSTLRTSRLLTVSFEKLIWTNKNLIDKPKGQKV